MLELVDEVDVELVELVDVEEVVDVVASKIEINMIDHFTPRRYILILTTCGCC